MMKATMAVIGGALGLALLGTAQAQTPTQPAPQERVAALKQSLAEDQARLRQYEWIETTAVSLKGEEKSRKQNRCYHGARFATLNDGTGYPGEVQLDAGAKQVHVAVQNTGYRKVAP